MGFVSCGRRQMIDCVARLRNVLMGQSCNVKWMWLRDDISLFVRLSSADQ